MDHFFQMDPVCLAEFPMLEGYTALGFVAARTSSGSRSASWSPA